MGENEYGESGYLSIFTLLKHLMMLLKYLMMLLKYNFFRASLLHLSKDTDSIHTNIEPCSSDFVFIK